MRRAQQIAIGVVAVVAIFLLVGVVLFFKSCGRPGPKLNENQIQEMQIAIEERQDSKLRSTLANVKVQEQILAGTVDNSAANTARATQKAKEDVANMNTNQLAEELEKYK